MRKKAKYLHDAPSEALIPGFAGTYHGNGSHTMPNMNVSNHTISRGMPVSQSAGYYPQTPTSTYPQFTQMTPHNSMPPQLLQNTATVPEYTTPSTIASASHFASASTQQLSPVHSMVTPMTRPSMDGTVGNTSYDTSFLDTNDPTLFNFNISDLNFGNHYGALEFGMLGQMSSGALNTPEAEGIGSMNQADNGDISYEGVQSGYGYNQAFPTWQTIPYAGIRQSSTQHLWPLNNNTLAVSENFNQLNDTSEPSGNEYNEYSSNATASPELPFTQADDNRLKTSPDSSPPPGLRKRKRVPFPNDSNQAGFWKRSRQSTTDVYSKVVAPYPYTEGFRKLTEYLHTHFPKDKVLRIARALASIRPSFISCNKSLNYEDLIFMERCFQRTALEYDDFIDCYGSPTIIVRRTGEVAQVSREFALVTGWRAGIISGKEPNLNVNTGRSGSGTQSGANTKGTTTPRISSSNGEMASPAHVLLPELLDEDSIVQFYEDFAELAFGASRSSIIGAPCHLIKYKTKDDPGWGSDGRLLEDGEPVKGPSKVKVESLMQGEAGMHSLGEEDGKVEAVMAWTVKRDFLDIPMMVVINVGRGTFAILRLLADESSSYL